jgi:transposase-like protein
MPLQIHKPRGRSYFPSFLESRWRAERVLLAVTQAEYMERVSIRKVDELVQGLGLTGLDRTRVSRTC